MNRPARRLIVQLTRRQLECAAAAMVFDARGIPAKIDGERATIDLAIVNETTYAERKTNGDNRRDPRNIPA